jgi:hypothetical protein
LLGGSGTLHSLRFPRGTSYGRRLRRFSGIYVARNGAWRKNQSAFDCKPSRRIACSFTPGL